MTHRAPQGYIHFMLDQRPSRNTPRPVDTADTLIQITRRLNNNLYDIQYYGFIYV